jgi:hypothetical protein
MPAHYSRPGAWPALGRANFELLTLSTPPGGGRQRARRLVVHAVRNHPPGGQRP